MQALVKQKFEEISVKSDIVIADKFAEKFAIKLSFSLSAFDKTVICSDCNAADTKAKLLLNTHKFFSFSPTEIGKFIIVSSNKEHKIDKKIAVNIWYNQQETFLLRLQFVDTIANLAATNKYWYQSSAVTAKETEMMGYRTLKSYGLHDINRNPIDMLYDSNPYQGKNSNWRFEKRKKYNLIPSSNDIEHLKNIRNEYWNKVEDDWVCPICMREKINCVQPSKKNPWVFVIYKKPFFKEDKDCYDKDFLCQQCCRAHNLLHKEVDINNELELASVSLITREELKRLVISYKNDVHEIDNEYLEKHLLQEMEYRLFYIDIE
jgi:hypothetical protein